MFSFSQKANGARPQSVASIHTTAPNTPTLEELQSKLESSNRNIMNIKDQQQQLLRVQQAAKNHLYEMEQIRNQQQPLSFANQQNAPPDYDNVEDVTQDVSALMSRMKTLTDFIHSQNDLANSLGGQLIGDDKTDLIEEQTQLQKKLLDLKNKKQQMANLVSELHAMNMQAENNFDESNNKTAHQQAQQNIVHDDESSLEGHSLLEQMHNDKMVDGRMEQHQHHHPQDSTHSNAVLNGGGGGEDDEDDEVAAAADGSMLQYKIAEINALKDQLKRLQDMMHTVKLIEIKNGDYQPLDDETEEVPFNVKPQEHNEAENNLQPSNEDPQRDEEEQEMAERVRVLHSMTNDLREQAG